MTLHKLRQHISAFLNFNISKAPTLFTTDEVVEEDGYTRYLINLAGLGGDPIPAFFLLPYGAEPFAAVLIHHQHHHEWHLGKSEVCGLAGDSLQAFGPALARRGIAVLAPDSICFEDRRTNHRGIEPDLPADEVQHFNEMCYRLLDGDSLMRKVLEDSARGISLLCSHPLIDPQRVGMLGHSYGGNTTLFHAALDERIQFACSSGAACSYQYKMAHQTGIEMAEVIPGFAQYFDIQDLVACCAPRSILLVSADGDQYSQDADQVEYDAHKKCAALNSPETIVHKRYKGGHSLTQERFDFIVEWIAACAD